MSRKCPLVSDQIYHIFSRSIADFKIFNNDWDYQRMLMLLYYFQIKETPNKFSYFIRNKGVETLGFYQFFTSLTKYQQKLNQIIAYCLMPTHIHLVIKQIDNHGISIYLNKVLNSYSRYFNTYHKRKGPLWEQRFKNVLVENDEQLVHLTRYVHLNPVSASLVKKPEHWQFSSYLEYLKNENQFKLCSYEDLLDISPKRYKKFVKDHVNYQKELSKINKISIDS